MNPGFSRRSAALLGLTLCCCRPAPVQAAASAESLFVSGALATILSAGFGRKRRTAHPSMGEPSRTGGDGQP